MSDNTPLSPLVYWPGRVALTCLVLIPLSVAGVRFGILHFSAGLPVFALACLLSLAMLILLAIVSLMPKFKAQRAAAIKRSLAALPGVLLAGALLGSAGDYPPIHDITTDTDNPPLFVQGVIERGENSNTLDIKPDTIAAQLQAYPDLATLQTQLQPAAAMARAADIATKMNWTIYNNDPATGLIEASYTSFWFGFVDDIAIRFSATATGTAIDLRSVSRVGVSDIGANANRIRAFTRAYQAEG